MCTIGSYHVMIVSKYFKTVEDFINLEFVCKKFNDNMEKFHYNPIPLTFKTLKYFPNIETLHLWNKDDDNFGNKFKENIENDKFDGNHKDVEMEKYVVSTK
ncbi:leucine rich repeat containing protein BspA family protein, partial [Entamoeba invadens IP1]